MTKTDSSGNTRGNAYKPLLDRFVDKIELDLATGCWNWTASVSTDGYGYIGLGENNRILKAHQAAWILFKGELVKGLEIDHLCRRRHCANPNHLRLATDKQQCENRLPKQVCGKGHKYEESGFYWRTIKENGIPRTFRICKACTDATEQKKRHKAKLARAAMKASPSQTTLFS